MDDTQHELLRSLGTIGEVQENDRLDAKGTKLEIQKPSLYNSFMRTFVYRQTKDDTISRVKSVAHEAFGEVDRYVKTSKPTRKQLDFLSLLLDEMQGSVRGLQNLQKTYAGVSASQDMKLYAKDMQKKCNMLREYLIKFGVIDDDDSSSGVVPVERRTKRPVERTVERTVERVAHPVKRTVEKLVDHAVDSAVDHAVDNAVDHAVDHAVDRAVDHVIDHAVDHAVDDVTESKTESSSMPMVYNKKKNADRGLNSRQSVRGVRPPPLDLSLISNVIDCSPRVYGAYEEVRVPSYTYGGSTPATPVTTVTTVAPETSPATEDDEDDDISCGTTISSTDSSFF